jgi:hypothetical protein
MMSGAVQADNLEPISTLTDTEMLFSPQILVRQPPKPVVASGLGLQTSCTTFWEFETTGWTDAYRQWQHAYRDWFAYVRLRKGR